MPTSPEKSKSVSRLFPLLTDDQASGLASLVAAVDKVMPIKAKHARMLPKDVAELSSSLTGERGGKFNPDYMARPGDLSAYLRYFLPWNVYRLTRLFSSLDLGLSPDSLVADVGAGPATALLALWLARPELREAPLRWHLIDRSKRPMLMGLKILDHVAGKHPWKIRLTQGPVNALRQGGPSLVVMANVINELSGADRGKEGWAERLAELVAAGLNPTSSLLAVEPGTRVAARGLVALRDALIEEGIEPVAPCPHAEACPMPGTAGRSWCHFSYDVHGAPLRLRELSQQAGLPKDHVNLSFIHMAPAGEKQEAPQGRAHVRVISGSFSLPGPAWAVYGCFAGGLALLRSRTPALPPSGALLEVSLPGEGERDAKSGALIIDIRA